MKTDTENVRDEVVALLCYADGGSDLSTWTVSGRPLTSEEVDLVHSSTRAERDQAIALLDVSIGLARARQAEILVRMRELATTEG